MISNKLWHNLTNDESFTVLRSSPVGLTHNEALNRLLETGPNEIQAAKRTSAWKILFEQFKNILILILLIATAISLILGHGVESIAIAVIVLFAVGLGFIQEFRAERAIEALRHMAAPTASVFRDGVEENIPSRDTVSGSFTEISNSLTSGTPCRSLSRSNYSFPMKLLQNMVLCDSF